jgi:signal peptidase I
MAKKRKEKEERHIMYVILKWITDLFVVAGAAAFLIVYLGESISVLGYSMDPTLTHEDQVLVDKARYHFEEPERFDVIVFSTQAGEQNLIKRIIGLPGETVQIRDGRVYIDGKRLTEPFETEKMLNAGLAGEGILLGEDEYFVLGDNRNHSEDSRFQTVGNVSLEDIIGKIWLYVTNWDTIHQVR